MWRLPRERERNRTSAKEKVLHLNSRAVCSKSFHHPYRLRLRQRSKFMKRSRSSLSSRRLSKRLWKLTRRQAQIVAKRAESKRDIATLLASKSSLREAILIREILGPPRGLQALDCCSIRCPQRIRWVSPIRIPFMMRGAIY